MTDEEIRQAAARLLRSNLRQGVSSFDRQPYSFSVPSPGTYPYQWFWDSCFHAIVWARIDIDQAKRELLTLLRAQDRHGRIPHRISWDRRLLYPYRFYLHSRSVLQPARSQLVQPPVLAVALEKVFEASADRAFLEQTLPPAQRFYDWLARRRDPDGDGLVSIIHPYESGLDHRPAYDAVFGLRDPPPAAAVLAVRALDVWNRLLNYNLSLIFRLDRFCVEDVAYNCIYAQGLAALARLWAEIGDKAKAVAARRHARRVEAAILSKCRHDDGLYYDLYSRAERKALVKTVTCLFPLMLDSITKAAAKRLVDHLRDESEFWLPYPLPTVAAGEPSFSPTFKSPLRSGLWRGPTWVATNWFVAGGLRKHGFDDEAGAIVQRTRELIEKGGFREFYNPYTGRPYGAHSFGWSTLIVDLLATRPT